MTSPVHTIVGIAGSLRAGSYNAALLRAASQFVPETVAFEQATIRGIPLYDGDVEAASGLPEPVRELKDRIASAAGLLIVTPEYNNGVPGVLKNAIDWLSRPSSDIPRVFGKRPVALMGASPGRFGTSLSQAAWLPILRSLEVQPWFGPRLLVASAAKSFDAQGELIDDRIRAQLKDFMTGFAEFVLDSAKSRSA